MQSELVKNWFGDQFFDLHPLLQKLHVQGGRLKGEVNLYYGSGLAGIIGKRLARKMNLPGEGVQQLQVDISHSDDGLHWGRCFNNQKSVVSLFKPVGNVTNGYWVETTGPLTMHLTVEIIDGGWYWKCLQLRFAGLPVPVWLMPKTRAYKKIEQDQYSFLVEFSLPYLGHLVSYQGLLKAEYNE
ncbi:MAG: DUF4166 domain-containing protein [Oleiphilaceae bacterium]|nr:DUF4166 domain-containing protein [Oleiphilaceae bacterium]